MISTFKTQIIFIMSGMTAIFSSMIPSILDDPGSKGDAESARQKIAYQQQADDLLRQSERLKKVEELIEQKSLFAEFTIGKQTPNEISAMHDAFSQKKEELSENFSSLAYKIITDETLGENDAADFMLRNERSLKPQMPAYYAAMSSFGGFFLKECRTKFQDAVKSTTEELPAHKAEAIAACAVKSESTLIGLSLGTGVPLALMALAIPALGRRRPEKEQKKTDSEKKFTITVVPPKAKP